jgi:hypothetical protein
MPAYLRCRLVNTSHLPCFTSILCHRRLRHWSSGRVVVCLVGRFGDECEYCPRLLAWVLLDGRKSRAVLGWNDALCRPQAVVLLVLRGGKLVNLPFLSGT